MPITIDQAFALTDRYVELGKVARNPKLPRPIREAAQTEWERLNALEPRVLITCMICDKDFTIMHTLKELADVIARPRGICGPCASGEK